MQAIARPLLVLHSDPLFRERLRRVSVPRFDMHFYPGWSELRSAVEKAPPAALVVVDPYTHSYGTDDELAPELRALLWDFPAVTVVAALEVKRERMRDVRALGEWGVMEVISLQEEDTLEVISRRLRSAQGRPMLSLLERSLPPSLSGRARALLTAAAEVVSEGGHGRDLAAALRLSERTLLRWADQAGLPAPRRVLAWMRVLLASELLDDRSRSVLSIAYTCGYSSDSSLRRAIQDFTGVLLPDLRKQGAFATASRMFLKELEDTRIQGRTRRRAERLAARAVAVDAYPGPAREPEAKRPRGRPRGSRPRVAPDAA